MNGVTSVLSGLHGALLLARGRADGVRHVGDDMGAAVRSFWAALLCAPIFIGVLLLTWMQSGRPTDPAHAVALELLSFVISWAGYAVLSRPLVASFGRERRWPRFIAIWNWCNVVQYALLLVASVPGAAGAPFWLSDTMQLVGQGWALWLEWFAIGLALEVSGVQAAVVMAPDVLLGLLLAMVVAAG